MFPLPASSTAQSDRDFAYHTEFSAPDAPFHYKFPPKPNRFHLLLFFFFLFFVHKGFFFIFFSDFGLFDAEIGGLGA